jgi:4-methyl-5(b-hydroxyethyl)-thiazole monophosphate biosynthesis
LGGVAAISGCEQAVQAIRFAWENDKYVAAICAAPTILGEMGLLTEKTATCYPGCENRLHGANYTEAAAIVDGKLITGASAGCAEKFANCLIEALKGPQAALSVRQQIVIRP